MIRRGRAPSITAKASPVGLDNAATQGLSRRAAVPVAHARRLRRSEIRPPGGASFSLTLERSVALDLTSARPSCAVSGLTPKPARRLVFARAGRSRVPANARNWRAARSRRTPAASSRAASERTAHRSRRCDPARCCAWPTTAPSTATTAVPGTTPTPTPAPSCDDTASPGSARTPRAAGGPPPRQRSGRGRPPGRARLVIRDRARERARRRAAARTCAPADRPRRSRRLGLRGRPAACARTPARTRRARRRAALALGARPSGPLERRGPRLLRGGVAAADSTVATQLGQITGEIAEHKDQAATPARRRSCGSRGVCFGRI